MLKQIRINKKNLMILNSLSDRRTENFESLLLIALNRSMFCLICELRNIHKSIRIISDYIQAENLTQKNSKKMISQRHVIDNIATGE